MVDALTAFTFFVSGAAQYGRRKSIIIVVHYHLNGSH
jgi:hypothetical protein